MRASPIIFPKASPNSTQSKLHEQLVLNIQYAMYAVREAPPSVLTNAAVSQHFEMGTCLLIESICAWHTQT